MDELKAKESILLKNKYHILRMPNNKKKVELLEAYFSLLQYHKFMTGEEDFPEKFYIDDEFTQKYDWYMFNDTRKKLNELEYHAKLLYDKFEEIINAYKQNGFCEYEYMGYTKVNSQKMMEALWNFFSILGDDVLQIYYDMALGGNIHLNSGLMERMGYALDSTPIDNASISVKNIPYYLDFYTTIAHEIGHCYQFYLQKNQRNFASFDPYSEITSLLFEKLFVEYLKNNYLIKNDSSIKLENSISFLTNVSISKVVSKLLLEKKIGIINPYTLNYTCLAKKEDIKKEIEDDCGYARPFILEPRLDEFHYSFGHIISDYFIKKMKQDFNSGLKEFKDFICTVNYLPLDEVVEKYFDIDLVNENIKTLTKSYTK